MTGMRTPIAAVLAGVVLGATGTAAAAEDRTLVFRTRFTGLVATATWTTCPAPTVGDVCTDTFLLAFDSRTVDGKLRDRGPVVRTLTFVYRVVGGEIGAEPIAEWFSRTEDAAVDARPRLETATATADVPVLICTVFQPESGITCPETVPVDVTWTATGDLVRVDDHVVHRDRLRLENLWTRGWTRTATITGTVGAGPLGTLIGADLTRADQGEIVVQHPFE
ncbi:hypothetical protein ACFQV2_18395 [Actinokineospora soli]|uniref:Ig-like domain-containing protein n=1 Tax=Actinokineospora soli TaxID=1048753 RepID=A0ABW2TPK7_9PSEU